MNTTVLFNFIVDKETNTIRVERSFDAPIDLVWAAWTEPDLLDQWWAPKPYQAITKSMDFRVGGRWHYYMLGPTGDTHWCLFNYREIQLLKRYAGGDSFCDENGVENHTKPKVKWDNSFASREEDTLVTCVLQFESLTDLETIIKMGFREGFIAGMQNLDQYIAAQFYLRKKNSRGSLLPRVATYLNFPGTTEEAFLFYRSVFRTEFVNGIHRFGEIPPGPGQPLVADAVKRMILHVELPIMGNHILMGTDAPKEMGFSVTPGNNMHIQLEPDSRQEANRIFAELSAGGKIEMPMADMFFGSYFGSFTDRYGINWMINVQKRD